MENRANKAAARYFLGTGSFEKDKSFIAQDILKNLIETRYANRIYLETHEKDEKELADLFNGSKNLMEFDFDCNMVLERKDSIVVTGDLKRLSFEDEKHFCVKTSDSLLCFKLE